MVNRYRSVSAWVRDLEIARTADGRVAVDEVPTAFYLAFEDMARLRFARWLAQQGRISE